MGSECTPDEREFRYLTFYQAIHDIEKDIKKELKNPDMKDKKYSSYALVSQAICNKHKFLLKNEFDKNEARKEVLNYNDLIEKTVYKSYKINNKKISFDFPSNFIFINKDILEVIAAYIDEKYSKYLSTIYKTAIGGGCIIMKDAKDLNDDFSERYIILYNEIQENVGNEIDFFINIKDKKERNAAVYYILQNNLWDYFKKIKFDYKDEYKKIYNDYSKEIGYAVRCCNVDKIELYLAKMESKKQYELLNNSKNKHQNNALNNGQINPQNNFSNNAQGNPQNNIKNIAQNNSSNNSPGFNPTKNVKSTPQNFLNENRLKRIEYPTQIQKNSNSNNNPELMLQSAILFLFSIDEIRKYFGQNRNIDFQSFETIIKTNVGPNIKSMNTYEKIFSELLTKADIKNLINKDYYNQTVIILF